METRKQAHVVVVPRGRGRSLLAGFFLLMTIASLAFLATLFYWHPEIVMAGLTDVSKGLLSQLPRSISDWSASAHGHGNAFWGGFGGAVVLLWLVSRGIPRACCRRQLFFLTMLVTLPLAVLVLTRQWDAVFDLLKASKEPPHP